MTFKIEVPGKLEKSQYGQLYYAIDSKGRLNLVGNQAPEHVRKRYSFDFDENLAKKYELDQLPRMKEEKA